MRLLPFVKMDKVELRQLIASEGVDLSVEHLARNTVLDPAHGESIDWAKFDEVMSRDKLRPGQPAMTDEEEAVLINRAVKETRANLRAQQHDA